MKNDISQLERNQIEALQELGVQLQTLRKEQFVTVEEIASKTMIQPRLLRAIEDGRWDQLPEPVYVQGFIKLYAESLGLNGAEVASAFPLEITIRSRRSFWKDSPAAQLRPIHLYAAYIGLIILAVNGLSNLMNRSPEWVTGRSRLQQTLTIPMSSVASNSTSSNRLGNVFNQQGITDALTGTKPVRVEVMVTSQSWLRVEVDGKTEFQGILSEGTEKTWAADSELKLRAGNAGGVMLTYNNGKPKRLGELGTVKEITFSVDQQAASLTPSQTASIH